MCVNVLEGGSRGMNVLRSKVNVIVLHVKECTCNVNECGWAKMTPLPGTNDAYSQHTRAHTAFHSHGFSKSRSDEQLTSLPYMGMAMKARPTGVRAPSSKTNITDQSIGDR